MKILFYNEAIISGGIEKCLELLSRELKTDYEIEIVYTDDTKFDENIFNILSQNAYVHKLKENETIIADICIWCRLYFDYEKISKQIIAQKYYLWIHSKPRELPNCLLDNSEFMNTIEKIICVSETVKQEAGFLEKSIVIHNFVDRNIHELASKIDNPFADISNDTLKLVIVSRISSEKGFDRAKQFVETLIQNDIKFVLKIVGKGRNKEPIIRATFSKYKQVEFLGYKENPFPYIKNSDYLLVLSDYESWGNVITEAKVLGTPCIVADFPSAKEQIKDHENGIIVPLVSDNYTLLLKDLFKMQPILHHNLEDFSYINEIDSWKKILQ